MKRRAILAAALALFLKPGIADDSKPDLATWGTMSPVKKSEFFELKYREEIFGEKPKTTKAYLKLDKAAFLADQSVPVTALEKGASVWIYGKPTERTSTNADGRYQVDRQILNTTIVAHGETLEIKIDPKHKGPHKQVWLEAEVSRPGAALHVTYDGNDYKVVFMKKAFSIFKRQELPERPKKLKKKLLVEVQADTIDELPEKAKEGQLAYAVKRLVILDRRLAKTVYPLLYK